MEANTWYSVAPQAGIPSLPHPQLDYNYDYNPTISGGSFQGFEHTTSKEAVNLLLDGQTSEQDHSILDAQVVEKYVKVRSTTVQYRLFFPKFTGKEFKFFYCFFLQQAGKHKYSKIRIPQSEIHDHSTMQNMMICLSELAAETKNLSEAVTVRKQKISKKAFAVAIEASLEAYLRQDPGETQLQALFTTMLPYLHLDKKFLTMAVKALCTRNALTELVEEARGHPKFLRFARRFLASSVNRW